MRQCPAATTHTHPVTLEQKPVPALVNVRQVRVLSLAVSPHGAAPLPLPPAKARTVHTYIYLSIKSAHLPKRSAVYIFFFFFFFSFFSYGWELCYVCM